MQTDRMMYGPHRAVEQERCDLADMMPMRLPVDYEAAFTRVWSILLRLDSDAVRGEARHVVHETLDALGIGGNDRKGTSNAGT